jgi:ATP-dependent RNA helicase DDX10/DBP4
MAFLERAASTSKSKGKGKPVKVKSNIAKRETFNSELKDLQKRIDNFVRHRQTLLRTGPLTGDHHV